MRRFAIPAMLSILALISLPSLTYAQFGGFVDKLQKAAKQVQLPKPSVEPVQNQTQAPPKAPQAPITSTVATELSDAEWEDLSEHSEEPIYLRKYAARLVRASGEISYFDDGYSVANDTTGYFWCTSNSGTLPSKGNVTIQGVMTTPYIFSGEDRGVVQLKECRLWSAKQAARSPATLSSAGNPSPELDRTLIGKKDSFCNRSFCQGSYTSASGLDTDLAKAILAETKTDAPENCIQSAGYNGEEESPRLRAKCARATPDPASNLKISANCGTGELYVVGYGDFSQHYIFKGLNKLWRRGADNVDKQGNIYTKYRLWNVDENEMEQSNGPSHYDMGVIFFQHLCPSYVPDWQEDSEGVAEI